MEQNSCYLIGAGSFYGMKQFPRKGDFVIAVDGGFSYAQELALSIDCIIGDFDSIDEIPAHQNIIRLQVEKDDTDMRAAMYEGLKRGYKAFHIYGGTGGRLDHTLANIQCLAYLAENDARGFLYDETMTLTAIHNDAIQLPIQGEGTVSILSLTTEAVGVSINGLKYELKDATLEYSYPLGVSNEFLGERASISVRDGTLVVCFQ